MLIDCVECGKRISDRAAECPKCGAPVELKPQVEMVEPTVSVAPVVLPIRTHTTETKHSQDAGRTKNTGRFALVVLGFFATLALVQGWRYLDSSSNLQQAPTDSTNSSEEAPVKDAPADVTSDATREASSSSIGKPTFYPQSCGESCVPQLLKKYSDVIHVEGNRLVIQARNGKTRTYEPQVFEEDGEEYPGGEPVAVIEGPDLLIVDIPVYEGGMADLISLDSGEVVAGIDNCESYDKLFLFSPDGSRFITHCKDFEAGYFQNRLSVYRFESGRAPVKELELANEPVEHNQDDVYEEREWAPGNVIWLGPNEFKFDKIVVNSNYEEALDSRVTYALSNGKWRQKPPRPPSP